MCDSELAVATLKATPTLTCVLCRGETVYRSEKKGIAPMMDFLEEGIDLCGFSAADRVVGRAAALLFVLAGVKEVYSEVLSEGALQVFHAHGIPVRYGTLTPYIINRQGNGPCPMEHAVRAIDDPHVAHGVLKRTLADLRGH